MNESKPTPEPKFFLQDELIYFLQKNAKLSIKVGTGNAFFEGHKNKFNVQATLTICDKEICKDITAFEVPETADSQIVEENTEHIRNLITHLLSQQKRIEALEKALSQYDQPINPTT